MSTGASNLVGDVEEDELQLKTQLTAFIEDYFFSFGDLKKKLKKNVKKRAAVMVSSLVCITVGGMVVAAGRGGCGCTEEIFVVGVAVGQDTDHG